MVCYNSTHAGRWHRGLGAGQWHAALEHPTQLSLYSLVVLPDIWMMHLESRLISRELKGRTRTATFTEAPAISAASVGHSQQWQELQRRQRTPEKKGTWN